MKADEEFINRFFNNDFGWGNSASDDFFSIDSNIIPGSSQKKSSGKKSNSEPTPTPTPAPAPAPAPTPTPTPTPDPTPTPEPSPSP